MAVFQLSLAFLLMVGIVVADETVAVSERASRRLYVRRADERRQWRRYDASRIASNDHDAASTCQSPRIAYMSWACDSSPRA